MNIKVGGHLFNRPTGNLFILLLVLLFPLSRVDVKQGGIFLLGKNSSEKT